MEGAMIDSRGALEPIYPTGVHSTWADMIAPTAKAPLATSEEQSVVKRTLVLLTIVGSLLRPVPDWAQGGAMNDATARCESLGRSRQCRVHWQHGWRYLLKGQPESMWL